MRRGGALRGPPGRVARRPRAAIDDNALLAPAHLETERAGMRRRIESDGRRRAAIHEHQGAVAGELLEADLRRRLGGLALDARAQQYRVDHRRRLLVRAVEQRETAIAM